MLITVCPQFIMLENGCKFETDEFGNGTVVGAHSKLFVPCNSDVLLIGMHGDVQLWKRVYFKYNPISDIVFMHCLDEELSSTGVGIRFMGICYK